MSVYYKLCVCSTEVQREEEWVPAPRTHGYLPLSV